MRFERTLFCWEKTQARLVGKCYGIKNGNPVPDNFKVGDMVKLYVHIEELGFVIHALMLAEETFATEEVELSNGIRVSTEELWSVHRDGG